MTNNQSGQWQQGPQGNWQGGPGYPPQGGWQQPPAVPKKRRRGLIAALGVVGVLLLASLIGVGLLLVNPSPASATEIVLEAADSVGRDPFSVDPFASAPPTPTATPTPKPSAAAPAPAAPVSGAAPGLYGGTQDIGKCDAQQLVAFLEANLDKARAWVAALNSDPNLNWPGGALQPTDIRAYVATLTSVVLMADTRVTNHGYSNGSPTPLQYVLQAGTAVLVDKFGVPRARCYCGNPLIPAASVPASVPFTGTPWPGFDPNKLVIVVPSLEALDQLLLGNFLDPTKPVTIMVLPPLPGANTSTPNPTGTPTPAPTDSSTPSPTPTPTADAGPPAADGRPADATEPHRWECNTGTADVLGNPSWDSSSGKTYDIWEVSWDDCTVKWVGRIEGMYVSFSWQNWAGTSYVITAPGDSTTVEQFWLTGGPQFFTLP